MAEVAELEYQKEGYNRAIKRMEQVKRLLVNPDFKTFIMEGFCLNDAARYVQEAGDPLMPKENREDALNMAMASGHLKRFIAFTLRFGETAQRGMEELDSEIELARQEADYAAANPPEIDEEEV